MGARMTDLNARLTRHNGKWDIAIRRGAGGDAETVWLSLGVCACHKTATRLWLACLTVDKR